MHLTAEDQLRLTNMILEDVVGLRMSVARALGDDVLTCVFFSQLYFLQRNKDPRLLKPRVEMIDDGWVWKTQEEWKADTCLSREQQETARKKLKSIGILEEKHDRMQHRMFYRLIPEKLFPFFLEAVRKESNVTIPHSGMEKDDEQCDNSTQGNVTIPHSSIYKNTKKNTSATPDDGLEGSSVPPIPAPPLEHPSTPSVVDLPPTTSAAAPPFDSDEYIDDMMDPDKEKNKAVRLIGNYLFYLGDQYPSAKAIGSVIRQNVRLANTIVEEGWTEEEIEGLMEELANDSFWKNKHWSLKNFKDRLPKYRADFAAKKNQKIVRHL